MSAPAELSWQRVGSLEPAALVSSRLQLHWAAQTVSAVAASLLEGRADDSHRSLAWCRRHGALVSMTLPKGHRAGLRLTDLIVFIEKDGEIEGSFPFDGRTLDDGFAWWREQAGGMAGVSPQELARAEWEMPEHAVGGGAAFDVSDAGGLAEMSRYYANADLLLEQVAEGEAGASAVRCWPHHFDIATLIGFDDDAPADAARSIGLGMSPGDESYAEPYFYANPWPRPKAAVPPTLPGGGLWHEEGWFGAVLTASRIRPADDPTAQHQQVEAFLAAAIGANKDLLGF